MQIRTRPLSPELWPDFEAYFNFGGTNSGCWCMNHRLPVGLNIVDEAARLSMQQLVQSGRVHGVLAYADGDPIPVGWCSLDLRHTLPGHDCVAGDLVHDTRAWAMHCVTSRHDFKNRGVEKRLSEAALELATSLNARFVEAYPEPDSQTGVGFKIGNSFSGYESELTELAYERVERDYGLFAKFYRPMRKMLERP